MYKTIIYRHRRENKKKCSLKGLEKRDDCLFFSYPTSILPDTSSYVLLSFDGKPLSEKDCDKGIFLVDGTWHLAEKMNKTLPPMEKRSLPSHFKTAYPRRQTGCSDPSRGLASIEALYIAYVLMGKDPKGLLDHYYFREKFLSINDLKAY